MLAGLGRSVSAARMYSAISGGGRQSPGILLYPLVKGAKLREPHPDDTWRDKYQEVMEDVVVPAATRMVDADIPTYWDRLTQFLSNNCMLSANWSFSIELIYRSLVGEDKLTDDRLTNMWILRACQDLSFSGTTVLDDLTEGSATRLHRPAWHTTCQGGIPLATYDAVLLYHVPYYLVNTYFQGHPHCSTILDAVMKGSYRPLIGTSYELLTAGNSEKTMENYLKMHTLKTGNLFRKMPALGMLLAEVTDKKLISSMQDIFKEFGLMEQCWDDFSEVASDAEHLGKPTEDIERGVNTWTSAMAMTTLDPSTRQVFKDCYGSSDPEKISKVRLIYSNMNIPKLYLEHMKRKDMEVNRAIENIPDERLRGVCYSFKDWLIGGIHSEEVEHICNSA